MLWCVWWEVVSDWLVGGGTGLGGGRDGLGALLSSSARGTASHTTTNHNSTTPITTTGPADFGISYFCVCGSAVAAVWI